MGRLPRAAFFKVTNMHNNLALLADFLETSVPPEKFDIRSFRDSREGGGGTVTDAKLLKGCGTTACAVGWACVIPELKQQGLRWDWLRSEVMLNGVEAVGYGQAEISEFFGITKDEFHWLFYFDSYPGRDVLPAEVISRMRHLLAGGDITNYKEPTQ